MASELGTTLAGGLATKVPRREILDGLNIVAKAVATRSSLPILMHVLIRRDADSGRVVLTASDLEMWLEHTLPPSLQPSIIGEGGGGATAPARNLAELLSAMPEADVELSTEAGAPTGRGGSLIPSEEPSRALHLRCNRANYKLLGLDPDDFPRLPNVTEITQFTISSKLMREAIKETLFAVSTDEARPILTGILMVYKAGGLRLVATDTHRLAVRDIETKGGSEADAQAVVPARAMSELQRVIGSDDDLDVVVTLSDNQAKFQINFPKTGAETTLIHRLIEGSFPSYERVIPQSFDRKLTLERDPLLAALKRASIVAREGSANRVVLRTSDADGGGDRLTITATSGNLGNAYEEIEILREGNRDDVEIAFNAKYLIDVLSVLESEGLNLELTEPLRPGVVRPADDTGYFCVLMPMQVV